MDFAGFILSHRGSQIDPSITQAIVESSPTTELYWSLIVHWPSKQLAASTPKIATLLAPLQLLLSTKHEYTWNDEFETETSKSHWPQYCNLTHAKKLAYVWTPAVKVWGSSSNKRQVVNSPWSRQALVSCQTQSWYAIIELELLAVAWAITRCNIFLAGLPHFTVVTDHHPFILSYQS